METPDGSAYAMQPKFLSLVTSEEDAAAGLTSEVGKRAKARAPSSEKEDAAEEELEEESDKEHRHARERAKAGAPSNGKKRAAPAGARTSKAAKKKKTSAPTCQVRSDLIRIPLARRSRARSANTQRV